MKSSANVTVKYRAELVRAGVAVETREGKNLLLDNFFTFAAGATGSIFNQAQFGTSTNPVKRNSGTITFTSTGSGASVTVTASAGFFISSDVNRILKLTTGEELRVTSFTSGTAVVCSTSAGSITQGQVGAIHYVNDTALGAVVSALTSSLSQSNGGFNLSTATQTLTYTTNSPAASSAMTITEMGWISYNANLTGRVLLDTPLGLQSGDIIRLTLTVQMAFDTTAHTITGTYSGTSRFWGASSASGFTSRWLFSQSMNLYSAAQDLSTIHGTDQPSGFAGTPQFSPSSVGFGVYQASYTFDINTGNGTIAALGFGPWIHNLDTPFTKTNTQTFAVTFQFTITRNLVN